MSADVKQVRDPTSPLPVTRYPHHEVPVVNRVVGNVTSCPVAAPDATGSATQRGDALDTIV